MDTDVRVNLIFLGDPNFFFFSEREMKNTIIGHTSTNNTVLTTQCPPTVTQRTPRLLRHPFQQPWLNGLFLPSPTGRMFWVTPISSSHKYVDGDPWKERTERKILTILSCPSIPASARCVAHHLVAQCTLHFKPKHDSLCARTPQTF